MPHNSHHQIYHYQGNRRCLVESLPDHLLIRIFELLPFFDRLRIELVNCHWRQLAAKQSWSHFTSFSANNFCLNEEPPIAPSTSPSFILPSQSVFRYSERFSPIVRSFDDGKRSVSLEELQTLFRRCGAYLLELDLEGFSIYPSFCYSILPMLPNLRYLNMGELVESAELLLSIPKWLDQLSGIVLKGLHRELLPALSKFLHATNNHLEYVELTGSSRNSSSSTELVLNNTLFSECSPSLVFLKVSEGVEVKPDFLRQLAEGCPSLRSLWMGALANAKVLLALKSLARRLHYLHLELLDEKGGTLGEMPVETAEALYGMINSSSLSSLAALELVVPGNGENFFSTGVLLAIANKCLMLEHLSIRGYPSPSSISHQQQQHQYSATTTTPSPTTLYYPPAHLIELAARLPRLRSLTLWNLSNSGSPHIGYQSGVPATPHWLSEFLHCLATNQALERLELDVRLAAAGEAGAASGRRNGAVGGGEDSKNPLCELVLNCCSLSHFHCLSITRGCYEHLLAAFAATTASSILDVGEEERIEGNGIEENSRTEETNFAHPQRHVVIMVDEPLDFNVPTWPRHTSSGAATRNFSSISAPHMDAEGRAEEPLSPSSAGGGSVVVSLVERGLLGGYYYHNPSNSNNLLQQRRFFSFWTPFSMAAEESPTITNPIAIELAMRSVTRPWPTSSSSVLRI